MPGLIGIAAAALIVGVARTTGFERDRSFYPTILIVIALLYVLFGVETGSLSVVAVESVVAVAFSGVAVVAHRRGLAVLLGAGLIAHGLWDALHSAVLPASDEVPLWWPAFCLGVDLTLGLYVLLRWPHPHDEAYH